MDNHFPSFLLITQTRGHPPRTYWSSRQFPGRPMTPPPTTPTPLATHIQTVTLTTTCIRTGGQGLRGYGQGVWARWRNTLPLKTLPLLLPIFVLSATLPHRVMRPRCEDMVRQEGSRRGMRYSRSRRFRIVRMQLR